MEKDPASKELRIGIAVPLPSDLFEQAARLSRLRAAIEAVKATTIEISKDASFDSKTVSKYAPRGSNPSEYEIGLAERAAARFPPAKGAI